MPPARRPRAAAAFPPCARALSAGPAVQRAARRGVPVGRVQPGAREPVGSASIGGGLFVTPATPLRHARVAGPAPRAARGILPRAGRLARRVGAVLGTGHRAGAAPAAPGAQISSRSSLVAGSCRTATAHAAGDVAPELAGSADTLASARRRRTGLHGVDPGRRRRRSAARWPPQVVQRAHAGGRVPGHHHDHVGAGIAVMGGEMNAVGGERRRGVVRRVVAARRGVASGR